MEYKSGKSSRRDTDHKKGPERFRESTVAPARAIVMHVEDRVRARDSARRRAGAASSLRSAEAKLDETVGLAAAIDLDIVDAFIVNLSKINPATLLGPGKVEEFAGVIAAHDAELVIVNAALSPAQQRNLERAWHVKILDRTGLILEIFGARAQTKEGRLQVELAHLTYQKSRLVRSWTHLERQRGGLGFVGGPGETQIEADRRQIQERISKLEKQLETVRQTRQLHRSSRQKVPYPVVALVGYTNAGKSTLFNALTDAKVNAEDLLFATLDPTMRRLELPSGQVAVLSDTVGFISDLPTDLVAAFRATLEEVLEADIIVHVRDMTHPDSDAQLRDVDGVLDKLGIDETRRAGIVEVWNKVDQLDDEALAFLHHRADRDTASIVMLSALTGQGLESLKTCLDERLQAGSEIYELVVEAADGAGLHWLHENTEVLSRDTRDDGNIVIRVRVPQDRIEVVMRRFGSAGASRISVE